MSSRSLGGGSSTRGSANYSTNVRLDDNVPANVIVRAGKNLRETIDPTEEFLLPAGEKRYSLRHRHFIIESKLTEIGWL